MAKCLPYNAKFVSACKTANLQRAVWSTLPKLCKGNDLAKNLALQASDLRTFFD